MPAEKTTTTIDPNAMKSLFGKLGLRAKGLVSCVDSYVNKKTGEERFSLILFVPGSSILCKVGLENPPAPNQYPPGQLVDLPVKLSEFGGKTYIAEIV